MVLSCKQWYCRFYFWSDLQKLFQRLLHNFTEPAYRTLLVSLVCVRGNLSWSSEKRITWCEWCQVTEITYPSLYLLFLRLFPLPIFPLSLPLLSNCKWSFCKQNSHTLYKKPNEKVPPPPQTKFVSIVSFPPPCPADLVNSCGAGHPWPMGPGFSNSILIWTSSVEIFLVATGGKCLSLLHFRWISKHFNAIQF